MLAVGAGEGCLEIFVSPAKQKRNIYIYTAFPVSSSSSAYIFVEFLRFGHFLRNYKG